ncbi:MAG: hypothetical protein ACM3PC_10790 [Deltaproteobacteria bacterium]
MHSIVLSLLALLAASKAGDSPSILDAAKTAFEYGPFYFAVLLLLTVSTVTGRAYRTVCQRPGATKQEIDAHRRVFESSFAVGLVLVVVSVVWWIAARPKVYMYTPVVRDLREYETVLSGRNVYFQAEPTSLIDDDGAQKRSEHILVVQDHPFSPGQRFQLEFAKDHKSRGTYDLEYVDGEKEPTFVWTFNPDTGKNELKRPQKSAMRLDLLVKPAFAAEAHVGPIAQAERASPTRVLPAPGRSSQTASLPGECAPFAVLSRPNASVGARIVAAEEVLALPDAVARGCVRNTPQGLDLAVSVKNLTRHSDPELANRAGAVAKKIGWEDAFVTALRSSDVARRRPAERAVQELEPSDSYRVLDKAGLSQAGKPRPAADGLPQRPIPTGTSYGDRYYVRASWDAGDAKVVDCLTNLFNSALDARRSLDEEKRLMRGRASRVVYSVEQDWAEHISAEIAKCGARPSYISY